MLHYSKGNFVGMKKKSVIIASLVIILLLGISLYLFRFYVFMSFFQDDDRIPYDQECVEAASIMNNVIKALEDFKSSNLKYPVSLKELVPKHIQNLPSLPKHFYTFEGINGMKYELLDGINMQPFEFKAEMNGGALNSDITLYYQKENKLKPTNDWVWDKYKHKEKIGENWVYCW